MTNLDNALLEAIVKGAIDHAETLNIKQEDMVLLLGVGLAEMLDYHNTMAYGIDHFVTYKGTLRIYAATFLEEDEMSIMTKADFEDLLNQLSIVI